MNCLWFIDLVEFKMTPQVTHVTRSDMFSEIIMWRQDITCSDYSEVLLPLGSQRPYDK